MFKQKMNAMKRLNQATDIFERYILNSEFAHNLKPETILDIKSDIKNNKISCGMYENANLEAREMIQSNIAKFCKTREFKKIATLLESPRVVVPPITITTTEQPVNFPITIQITHKTSIFEHLRIKSRSLSHQDDEEDPFACIPRKEDRAVQNDAKPFLVNLDFDKIVTKEESRCPKVIQEILFEMKRRGCCKTEGIFRMSGSHVEIHEICKLMNDGECVDWKYVKNIHSLAAILKIYLRSLPEPIISFDLYPEFIKVTSSKNDDEKLDKLLNLVIHLPDSRRHTLGILLEFLHEIEKNSKVNMMDVSNLATIFGVNVMRPDGTFDSMREFYEVPRINQAFKELLIHFPKMRQMFW